MIRLRLFVTILCACLASSGCTTLRAVPLGESGAVSNADVTPGREAKIGLKDGSQVIVHIVSVDGAGIAVRSGDRSEPYRIAYADMQSLQVRKASGIRTVGAIWVGVVLVGGLLIRAVMQDVKKNIDD